MQGFGLRIQVCFKSKALETRNARDKGHSVNGQRGIRSWDRPVLLGLGNKSAVDAPCQADQRRVNRRTGLSERDDNRAGTKRAQTIAADDGVACRAGCVDAGRSRGARHGSRNLVALRLCRDGPLPEKPTDSLLLPGHVLCHLAWSVQTWWVIHKDSGCNMLPSSPTYIHVARHVRSHIRYTIRSCRALQSGCHVLKMVVAIQDRKER